MENIIRLVLDENACSNDLDIEELESIYKAHRNLVSAYFTCSERAQIHAKDVDDS